MEHVVIDAAGERYSVPGAEATCALRSMRNPGTLEILQKKLTVDSVTDMYTIVERLSGAWKVGKL